MDAPARFLALPDGRHLAYAEYGAPDGYPLLYCHGFPSSRREASLLHDAARTERIRIIAPDRPGYGESAIQFGRSFADWSSDVLHLANRLGLGRFALLGTSGGGPYALACAWYLRERVTKCALVCPLGPIYLDSVLAEMDWMSWLNFTGARHTPFFSELMFGPLAASFFLSSPRVMDSLRVSRSSAADRFELSDPETLHVLNQAFRDAMINGARGARQDLLLYTREWGFPLERIDLDIDLWHGEEDRLVPISHTRWFASHLLDPNPRYLAKEGHYSLPLRFAQAILRSLLADQGR